MLRSPYRLLSFLVVVVSMFVIASSFAPSFRGVVVVISPLLVSSRRGASIHRRRHLLDLPFASSSTRLFSSSSSPDAAPAPLRLLYPPLNPHYSPLSRSSHPRVSKAVRILYQDRHLLVVDKPSGLCSVPSSSALTSPRSNSYAQYSTDLASFLLGAEPEAFQKGMTVDKTIVHRLDQATSGLLLLAATTDSQKWLFEMFRSKSIEKTYEAIIKCPPSPSSIPAHPANDSGVVDIPIIRDWRNLPFMCRDTPEYRSTVQEEIGRREKALEVSLALALSSSSSSSSSEGADWPPASVGKDEPSIERQNGALKYLRKVERGSTKSSVTSFSFMHPPSSSFPPSSPTASQPSLPLPPTRRVSLVPITGRTHQLRLHCLLDGRLGPIVGDREYGWRGDAVDRRVEEEDLQMCLHARDISFVHPVLKERMTFKSEVPF